MIEEKNEINELIDAADELDELVNPPTMEDVIAEDVVVEEVAPTIEGQPVEVPPATPIVEPSEPTPPISWVGNH